MKAGRIVIIFLMLLYNFDNVMGQNDIIKGRAFAFPIGGGAMYSLGLGYERVVGNNLSLQLLYNLYGSDSRGADGPSIFYTNLIPEVKFYINPSEGIHTSYYFSFFNEFQKSQSNSSGEGEKSDRYSKQISPGLAVGKNITMGKKWHLELYFGGKYNFGKERKEEEEYMGSTIVISTKKHHGFGLRGGLNIAFQL